MAETGRERTNPKTQVLIHVALALLVPFGCAVGGDLGSSTRFEARAGGAFSLGGSWTSTTSMREATKPGPDLELAAEKRIGDHFAAELDLALAWMRFKEGELPGPAASPSFTAPALLFSNRYYLTTHRARPFVSAGAGAYFWRVNTDGVLRSVLRRDGARFEKMSYGLHVGAGGELALSKRTSIVAEARWHYIFSRDRFVFGSGFTNQGVLTAALGASVSFTAP